MTFDKQSLGNTGAEALVKLLSVCPLLYHLRASACQISADGVKKLAPAIASHLSFLEVNLAVNPIGTLGLISLLPAIEQQLVQVWLYSCALTDADLSLLIASLMKSQRMKMCDCEINDGVHT